MKKFLLLSVIAMTITCCSCSQNESEQQEKLIFREEMYATVTHGIEYPDPEIGELALVNNEVHLSYFVENGLSKMTYGLLVFTNGAVQPYSVAGEHKNIHLFDLDEYQTKKINISFNPVMINPNKNNFVSFILMLDPLNIPPEAFCGHLQAITQLQPWKIVNIDNNTLNCNYDFITDIASIQHTANILVADENQNALSSIAFDLTQEVTLNQNSPFEIPLNLQFSESGSYIISVYLNNVALNCFNGKKYLNISPTQPTEYMISLELSESDFDLLHVGDNTLYAVSIPVHNESSDFGVEKSSSVVVHY